MAKFTNASKSLILQSVWHSKAQNSKIQNISGTEITIRLHVDLWDRADLQTESWFDWWQWLPVCDVIQHTTQTQSSISCHIVYTTPWYTCTHHCSCFIIIISSSSISSTGWRSNVSQLCFTYRTLSTSYYPHTEYIG